MTEPDATMLTFVGWKEIAAALAVSERTAMRYADRNEDRLPAEQDHAGRWWIYRASLGNWMARQVKTKRGANARKVDATLATLERLAVEMRERMVDINATAARLEAMAKAWEPAPFCQPVSGSSPKRRKTLP